ncbi:1-phosphofructokinase family hexose kinase [Corynebacterium mendelii]|uniref:1-phosphofructokinase n=1 Tax=Corynebacterium mendelii TaxID=2765362 RepID=A0A939DYT1_9CORY|nr:PfkB family carbohydrate kinase [Corynebacterium mendelii]MBN9643320.1 1-phosphofructokinase [Corynebacterium mendelii]
MISPSPAAAPAGHTGAPMCVTFTPNPSLDITLRAGEAIVRDEVHRMDEVTTDAGGKGINVARALSAHGLPVYAVVPCDPQDPFVRLVSLTRTRFEIIPTDQPVRVNTTITEPGGHTTKLNGPGPVFDPGVWQATETLLSRRAAGARWLVMAGSLPPQAADDTYPALAVAVKQHCPQLNIAVDTSGAALAAAADPARVSGVDLLAPNAHELVCVLHGHAPATADDCRRRARHAEQAAAAGDTGPARRLLEDYSARCARGGVPAPTVLLTLGAAGAMLLQEGTLFFAAAPKVPVASTVGAGDCALAGYIAAESTGAEPDRALAAAVTWGSAAATIPGTGIPGPEVLADCPVDVVEL